MENNTKDEVKQIIDQIKEFDKKGDYDEVEGAKLVNKIIKCGDTAVPYLLELINEPNSDISFPFAIFALGGIKDKRAIKPLADLLEVEHAGDFACGALKLFGKECIPEVIKRVGYRLDNPLADVSSPDALTRSALSVIGEIKCEESSSFLKNLLDEYIDEISENGLGIDDPEWRFTNLDFFHLLDCMVRQQDKSAIPYIKKARDFFPKEYTDHLLCQIAIGRIKKERVEGYLPMEALEIAMPSGSIMDMFSGGESNWEDNFDELYGEYLDDED